MSPLGIASTVFNLISAVSSGSSNNSSQSSQSRTSASQESDFSASLALRMASLQGDSIKSLLGEAFGSGKGSSNFDFLMGAIGQQSGTNDPHSMLGLAGN
ncbi:MAG: hypothetical protein QG672_323, partial [Pseudomonadota bacterium]|nr:hypothetical protein [Pseudomonadota bacterium]